MLGPGDQHPRPRNPVLVQRAVLQPFPTAYAPNAYHSTEEKLETIIKNLEAHHQQVKSDLLVQSLTTLTKAEEEPYDDKRRSSGALSRHQSDQAFLDSLHSRWNPRAPKPALATENQTLKTPEALDHNSSRNLCAIDEALTALDAYEKHSAKTMEKYYSARERMKRPPAEMAAPKPEQPVSYDASRDPRLRR